MSRVSPAPALFPMFTDLHGKSVLVLGAGTVAARKIEDLLAAGAAVRVVAPVLNAEVDAWRVQDALRHVATTFTPDLLDDVWLALAASDDTQANQALKAAADARRIFCNVVDQQALCSFQSPAVVSRGPLRIAISSGGAAPVLARQVRAQIETLLDPSLGSLAELLGRWRTRIRERLPALPARRRFLSRLADGEVGRLLRAGRSRAAERALAAQLGVGEPPACGLVSLVGAGPGAADLLTLGALRRLQEADLILYDSLVSREVLALARRDAERIETGKRAGGVCTAQDHIHALMLSHARAGRRVVRLKGGDPFVFGRGGEEIAFLRTHGIAYEVLPGITAANACAAYAGIPLTHRDHAQSVRLVTAHCARSLDRLDWAALADDRQTLAVYMGVAQLEHLRDRLLALGRAADTPCAIVENGSRQGQRVLLGRLDSLPEICQTHAIGAPALLIIGAVAALARELHWFGAAPIDTLAVGAADRMPAIAA